MPIRLFLLSVTAIVFIHGMAGDSRAAEEEINCITCHRTVTPGHVTDWESSTHAQLGVDCSVCHGTDHQTEKDVNLVRLPDESVCGECHADQFEQFKKGKHSHGWKSLNAMEVTHLEPDALMEGGRGCGGCHNMGVKNDAERQALKKKGYRYQNNSCDECHTRHTFAKSEAQDPHACQQCHMGYDHPQWEMWSSAKHGTRWFTKDGGRLPATATAPTCQTCHLPNGTHTNRTGWGFFGVRLPLPADKEWADDRRIILKALGIFNPKTGEPTKRLDTFKALDMARLSDEDWQSERDQMVKICSQCHSKTYAEDQLNKGDEMMKKADVLMAKAIRVVAALYEDGIIQKPAEYEFAYPDFFYFMRTGGKSMDNMSHIDQVLFEMYMKHRMRTYQGCFHVNPDYAYWYGWAMMTKDLGEIEELADLLRKTHAGKK